MNNFKPKNIILLGFMGAGKTSAGQILAMELLWTFMDLDQRIEDLEKLNIKEIFANYGEKYFRDLEAKEIEKLKFLTKHVISLGGGAFCNDKNIFNLKSAGKTIYLKSSFEILLKRFNQEEIAKRPLLQDSNQAKDLMEAREKFYAQADIIINTDNLTIIEVKDLILKNVLKHTSGPSQEG